MRRFRQRQATRRSVLAALVCLSAGRVPSVWGFQDEAAADAKDVVSRRAAEAGLGPLRSVETNRFLVLGEAPESLLVAASKVCEAMATDFLSHFQSRGFQVAEPESRLVIVMLSGPQAFARFLNVPMDTAIGGQYDTNTNRLVTFDQRAHANRSPAAERANTVSLLHEVTHQLTFNTGLLDRQREIPKVISEGLATYGEVRRPDGRTRVGAVNVLRVADLPRGQRAQSTWIPLESLIDSDAAFEEPDRQNVAYAEAWLLVYTLINDKARRPGLVSYLERLASGPEKNRLETAQSCLGDLDAIDRAMRSWMSKRLR